MPDASPPIMRNKWIMSILCIFVYVVTSILKSGYFDIPSINSSTTSLFFLNAINIFALIFYIKALIYLVRYADNILSPDVIIGTDNPIESHINKLIKGLYFIVNGLMTVYMIFFVSKFIYTCHTDKCLRITNIGNAFTIIYNVITIMIMLWMLTQLLFFTFLPGCTWLLPSELSEHKIKPITLYKKNVAIYIFTYSAFVLILNFAMIFGAKNEYSELLLYAMVYRIFYASYLLRSSIEYEIKTFRSAILWGMTCILFMTSYICDTIILIEQCSKNTSNCYKNIDSLTLIAIVNQNISSVIIVSSILYLTYCLYVYNRSISNPMYQRLLDETVY